MSVICCGGICIPYSALLPLLLLILRPVWAFVCKVLGIENFLEKKANTEVKEGEVQCSGGVCRMKGKSDGAEPAPVSAAEPIPEGPFYLSQQMSWKEVLQSSYKRPLLLRFTATWCKPCKEVEPLFTKLGDQCKGSATFASVDVDDFPDFMNDYQITGIPYVVAIRNGSVKDSYKGSNQDAMTNFIHSSIGDANIRKNGC